jgi:hypothetical protein
MTIDVISGGDASGAYDPEVLARLKVHGTI